MPERYCIPATLWQGKTVVVLASGPSMNAGVAEQVRASGHPAIAVNTTYRLALFADALCAADSQWWQYHYGDVARRFLGLKLTTEPTPYPDVRRLESAGSEGYDQRPGYVRTGGNSGYFAVHCAVAAGATRVLLCGFDMRGGHWHGRHPHGLRDHGDGIFATWLTRFATLVEPLAAKGVEVLNCAPGSALTCWPNVPLADALAERQTAAA